MTLSLYLHPLSSFCWKALIALYENDTPFEPRVVNLGDPASRAAFCEVWPIGKFPVLRDEAAGRTIPESTVIIEYLGQHHGGPSKLLPSDPEVALKVRLADRFYDAYVHLPMQKIVGDKIRPPSKNDPFGVDEAKTLIRTAYGIIERDMAGKTWAVGDTFTMADCSAAPALFYANRVLPFEDPKGHAASYLRRLQERPSFARVLKEAEPFFHMFPG